MSGVKRLAAAQGQNLATFDGSVSMPNGGRVQSQPKPKDAKTEAAYKMQKRK